MFKKERGLAWENKGSDFYLYLQILQMQVKSVFHSRSYKEDEKLKRTNRGQKKAQAYKASPEKRIS